MSYISVGVRAVHKKGTENITRIKVTKTNRKAI